MNLKIKYPEFKPRRYGPTIDYGSSKTIIPAESFFIGDFLATPYSIIRDRLKRWLEFEKTYQELHPGYQKLFDVSRKYKVITRENDGLNRRLLKLTDLNHRGLEFALSQRIRSEEDSYSLLRVGGAKAFDLDLDKGEGVDIYGGNVVLVGMVKSKGDARKAQEVRFKHVSVKGPFERSVLKFKDVNCDCEDSKRAREKQGYQNVNLVCIHAGALMYYASKNMFNIKGLREKGTQIFLPFNSTLPQKPIIDPSLIEGGLEWIISGEQPDLDHLVTDVILSRYFNKESLFSIGKKLTKIPVIYDRILESLILSGTVSFEVLTESYIFGSSKSINPAVRTLFTQIESRLEDQGKGFKKAGNCLEKRDSPYETIALIFKRDEEEVRLLFNRDFPPVAIVRRNLDSSVRIHHYPKPETSLHPFEELFMPKIMFDDKTRRNTKYEVIIPSEFPIPAALREDYKMTIAQHFPNGLEGFRQQVIKRGLKNQKNLLDLVA
ncbi:MAG: hypothetical protein V1663_04830 [archaeon]